jgi:hypothetical protein
LSSEGGEDIRTEADKQRKGKKILWEGEGKSLYGGASETTTKRAGSNPWLAGLVIGHGGVILPHYRCKNLQCSSAPLGALLPESQPSCVGFLGSRARRTIRLHPARRIRRLDDENFFVLLRSTCPFAAGVDFRTEILGINAVDVGMAALLALDLSIHALAQPRGCTNSAHAHLPVTRP